ncbi:ABC transporter ATP-binding protein [bacterium]|nr:ABC transporter ATP-binding protein [bacterium]
MWPLVKKYLHWELLAIISMMAEVIMDLLQPGLMSKIVDEGILGIQTSSQDQLELIVRFGFVMVFCLVVGCLGGSLNNFFTQQACKNIGNKLRQQLFAKIMSLSFSQVDRLGTGTLITRTTSDVTQTENLISRLIRGIVRTGLLMLGSLYCIFTLNRDFGLIALAIIPLTVIFLYFCMQKMEPLMSVLRERLDQLNSLVQEDIAGIRVIKACVKEFYEKKRFERENFALVSTQLAVLVLFSLVNPVINSLTYIMIALILWTGSIQVNLGETSPGAIMAAITYTTRLFLSIFLVTIIFQDLSLGIVSWKRIKEILSLEPEIKGGSFIGPTELVGQIEFKNVSFSYPGTNKKALDKVSFILHQGETLAIMGSTGSGKSTLLYLILRFYDIDEGEILLDGINIRHYDLEYLRNKVALAMQKSELFNLSIRKNILWGNPQAQSKELFSAASIAQADNFINETPDGYKTLITQGGHNVSGGQRQRLSIARALLKESEFILFDDSTSALDLKTEANLYEALNLKKKNITKIIVAQRIASVKRADNILILEDGHLIAQGPHDQLLKACDIYRDIYYSQIDEEAI